MNLINWYQTQLLLDVGYDMAKIDSWSEENLVKEWVERHFLASYSYIYIQQWNCQICCNWSRLKPCFNVPAYRRTMPQMNRIPHPITLYWHWAKQSLYTDTGNDKS